jgi:hypothetical protein
LQIKKRGDLALVLFRILFCHMQQIVFQIIKPLIKNDMRILPD